MDRGENNLGLTQDDLIPPTKWMMASDETMKLVNNFRTLGCSVSFDLVGYQARADPNIMVCTDPRCVSVAQKKLETLNSHNYPASEMLSPTFSNSNLFKFKYPRESDSQVSLPGDREFLRGQPAIEDSGAYLVDLPDAVHPRIGQQIGTEKTEVRGKEICVIETEEAPINSHVTVTSVVEPTTNDSGKTVTEEASKKLAAAALTKLIESVVGPEQGTVSPALKIDVSRPPPAVNKVHEPLDVKQVKDATGKDGKLEDKAIQKNMHDPVKQQQADVVPQSSQLVVKGESNERADNWMKWPKANLQSLKKPQSKDDLPLKVKQPDPASFQERKPKPAQKDNQRVLKNNADDKELKIENVSSANVNSRQEMQRHTTSQEQKNQDSLDRHKPKTKQNVGVTSEKAGEAMNRNNQIAPTDKPVVSSANVEINKSSMGTEGDRSVWKIKDVTVSRKFDGRLRPCYVSFVWNPAKFTLQIIEDEDNLRHLDEEVGRYAPGAPDITGVPAVDDIVIAKFYKDGQYYRAQVQKVISPEKVFVVFLDYGDTAYVTLTDCKKPSEKIMKYPILGVTFTCNLSPKYANSTLDDNLITSKMHEELIGTVFMKKTHEENYGLDLKGDLFVNKGMMWKVLLEEQLALRMEHLQDESEASTSGSAEAYVKEETTKTLNKGTRDIKTKSDCSETPESVHSLDNNNKPPEEQKANRIDKVHLKLPKTVRPSKGISPHPEEIINPGKEILVSAYNTEKKGSQKKSTEPGVSKGCPSQPIPVVQEDTFGKTNPLISGVQEKGKVKPAQDAVPQPVAPSVFGDGACSVKFSGGQLESMQLFLLITKEIAKGKAVPLELLPEEGEMVLVPTGEDDLYLRAKVRSMHGRYATVDYYDYPGHGEAHLEKLVEPSPAIIDYPKFGTRKPRTKK